MNNETVTQNTPAKIKVGVRRGVSHAINLDAPTDLVIATPIAKKERCIINGVEYESFTDAAYKIDKMNLVAAEVRRRCLSKKFKYREWNVKGVIKHPELKISLDGKLFESPVHAAQYIKMTPIEIRNRVYSKNPMYRHWFQLNAPATHMTYEEVDAALHNAQIKEGIATIRCEGKEFISIAEAANHFGVSTERIRQKLVSDTHTDYLYLY